MKITLYDLLGMVKNGKQPKAIKINGHYYVYDELENDYCEGMGYDYNYLFKNTSNDSLNDEVEILEEPKGIPEKIKSNGKEFYCDNIDSWIDKEKTSAYCEYLMNKYNDLIDYLESKGE